MTRKYLMAIVPALLMLSVLAGCVVVPARPVAVYRPPVVVVRP
jgi:hypothetical protein